MEHKKCFFFYSPCAFNLFHNQRGSVFFLPEIPQIPKKKKNFKSIRELWRPKKINLVHVVGGMLSNDVTFLILMSYDGRTYLSVGSKGSILFYDVRKEVKDVLRRNLWVCDEILNWCF